MNIKGVGHIIVQVKKPYNEEYDVKGHDGSKLVRDHRFNDFDNVNKSGVVVDAPKESGIPKGATLFFHHAIVEWPEKNVSEPYCIDKEKGLYRVPYAPLGHPDPLHCKAYAYEVDGEVRTINDWILLEQEKEKLEETENGLVIVQKIDNVNYTTGEAAPKQGYARVCFLNDYFKNMGLEEGNLVIMKKDAEYPIDINGKTYWRVWERFLLAKVDE